MAGSVPSRPDLRFESTAPAAAASAVSATAAPIPARGDDGSYPAHLPWDDLVLLRNGAGLCEWSILGIDLYDAALYLERRISSFATAFAPDQRYVLHLHFVRALTAAQLGEAFTAAVRANTADGSLKFAAPLCQLCSAMAEVGDGDAYTFCGAPGRGLAIYRNGSEVGRIDDEMFRRLFLQLYLGDKPPTMALRAGLLGKR